MSLIILSAILGIILMLSALWLKNSKSIHILAIFAAVILMAASVYELSKASTGTQLHFNNMLAVNAFSLKLNCLISFGFMAYVFLFHRHITKVGLYDGEYFALLLFSMSGVYLLTMYQSMFTLFLGIEIMSIPLYILAGADKRSTKSNEASLKYFLMGAFSTGFLLMGITLLFGATGTFDVTMLSAKLGENGSVLAILGVLFLLVAFAFKASAAPFHVWSPDVYDGTPTTFTPFLASIAKVAVFAAFIKIFQGAFSQIQGTWSIAILGIIVLTLLIGNVTALYQQSAKRMLAYSSIAQAGFLLFAIYATNALSYKGILLYGVVYILSTLGIFGVLVYLKDYSYQGFRGLATQHPVMAFTATISLLSLAGIPLTGGFFAKYYMLNTAMQGGMPIAIVIFAVLMAAVSVVYYFRIIREMYFASPANNEELLNDTVPAYYKSILIVIAFAIILLGILPGIATAV
jgi:NADH-quinone oxidoreductase subunit N